MISAMNRLQGQRGAVELIVAFALVAILGFAALIVDIGNAKQTRRNFQTAADSGSLAGAPQLPSPSASVTAAVKYAYASMNQPLGSTIACPAGRTSDPTVPDPSNTTCYQSSGGAIVYVTTPYTFTPPAGETIAAPLPEDAINVTICQTLQTTFARVLGIDTTHPCNSATAEIVPGTSTFPCAVCVMSKTGNPALDLKGTGGWTVAGGSILVNSSNSGGVDESGNPGTICDKLTPASTSCDGSLTWYACKSGTCSVGHPGVYQPEPTPQPTQIPDPLAFLPVPNFTTPTGKCTGGTCTPGVYTSAISGDETLQPGNYVFVGTNSGISLTSQSAVTGNGVTLYLACKEYPTPCNSGEQGAAISLAGGSSLNIAAPTVSGTTPLSGATQTEQGLAIYSDRNNTSSIFSITGTPSLTVKGTIYGLNSSVSMGGTSGGTFDSIFVVGTIELHGTPGADNEVPADNVHIPPTASAINLIG